ncbi:hypothetical protein [Ideonella paludis]|uniref:Uncharacterized protein n=1 Tax=Ideonella paludis TaxID=1233411 RepID=A0ABS5DTD9_9BURK|nr:hypothetical protein [Ideonella paludis]MBQ0934399.1 hypothetical protein [Ideonella paludis]
MNPLHTTARVDSGGVIACYCEDRLCFPAGPFLSVLPTAVGLVQMSGQGSGSALMR